MMVFCGYGWLSCKAQQTITCNGKQVLGSIEKIKLIDDNLLLDAKLDTGASMSSLTAKHIEIFRRKNITWVKFTVYLPGSQQKIIVVKPVKGFVLIRQRKDETASMNDNTRLDHRRVIIPLTICMGNQQQTILVNLIDRSAFTYPMLIGSNTIQQFNSVVDVSQRYLTKGDCH